MPPNKRKVGFLFQNYALWPNMTVYQNISLPWVHSSRKRESSRRQVMKGSIKPEMMEDFWMGMIDEDGGPTTFTTWPSFPI